MLIRKLDFLFVLQIGVGSTLRKCVGQWQKCHSAKIMCKEATFHPGQTPSAAWNSWIKHPTRCYASRALLTHFYFNSQHSGEAEKGEYFILLLWWNEDLKHQELNDRFEVKAIGQRQKHRWNPGAPGPTQGSFQDAPLTRFPRRRAFIRLRGHRCSRRFFLSS